MNVGAILVTERNSGTYIHRAGKVTWARKASPQLQTANIKLVYSSARARKRRTHKTAPSPFETLATKPGAKRKRASELASLYRHWFRHEKFLGSGPDREKTQKALSQVVNRAEQSTEDRAAQTAWQKAYKQV